MSNIGETDKTPLRDLLRRVARAFFATQHIVVLDQLAFHEQISDENLAKCVGLTVKEIHKLCGNLKEARLIKTYTKSEPKKAEARAIPRTYYNIDWQQVVNVIKWKIYRIRQMVSERMRNELENKGYLCPCCKKTFAPLEVRNLLDGAKQAFVCDVCSTELIHNDNAENVKGTELLHGRFMEQSQPIIDLLKIIDKMVIPDSSINQLQASTGAKGGQPGSTREQDLQYSQDTGANSGDIVVVFQDDNESSKIDKQNEMAKKRQQNALPAWHARSTVSGDATVTNAGNLDAAQENEHQNSEIVRVNEKDEQRVFYTDYYEKYKNDTDGSPMIDLEEEEFEEVEFGVVEDEFMDEFEEVDMNNNNDDDNENNDNEDIDDINNNNNNNNNNHYYHQNGISHHEDDNEFGDDDGDDDDSSNSQELMRYKKRSRTSSVEKTYKHHGNNSNGHHY
ncbi:hypothetical protein Glove_460g29 [Diversispora epigaea]|uniref:HTH TFE/IIEalpha-type domain-containing protein n=1 Tax=Diversispora epigaea TaxID=1348612 RepID=A0A397GND5_9GLOM|nr:hypothetical protein Glove_460g29 [Diversispora epigaea]